MGQYLFLETIPSHARAPFTGRLYLDGRFKHRHGCGIGRRFRRACLAENRQKFPHLFQAYVLFMQDSRGFLRSQAIGGGGHEKEVTLVQGRHELAAQAHDGDGSECQ